MKPKVLLPSNPDDTVTLCPLVDFRETPKNITRLIRKGYQRRTSNKDDKKIITVTT